MIPPTDAVAILSGKLYDVPEVKSPHGAFLMCPHGVGGMTQ